MRPPARPPQETMMLRLVVPFVPFGAVLCLTAAVAALAQEGAPAGGPAGAGAGRAVVLSKCFQCHTDAMFRDQRQDRRAWEATVYRMVGRGALWTPEEIKLMADYLGAEFGPAPAAKPASPH
jgi:mono/diheme cytochrome c family protein